MHIIRDISPQAYILSSSDIALGHPTYLPAARLSKGDSLPRQPIEPMHYRTDGSSKKEQKTERSAKIDERALLGISPLFLSINHTSFPLCRLSFFRVSCTGLIPPQPHPLPACLASPPGLSILFFFFSKEGSSHVFFFAQEPSFVSSPFTLASLIVFTLSTNDFFALRKTSRTSGLPPEFPKRTRRAPGGRTKMGSKTHKKQKDEDINHKISCRGLSNRGPGEPKRERKD